MMQPASRCHASEATCDIWVWWQPPHQQAVGWDPTINDGVRLNIRLFVRAGLGKRGRPGAGILGRKPNVGWKKDRAKGPNEPRPREDFPWFWGCAGDADDEARRTEFVADPAAEFDGIRWNDLHYRNRTKRHAHMHAHSWEAKL